MADTASCSSSAEQRATAAQSFAAGLIARSRFPADPRAIAFAGTIAQALAAGQQPLVRGLPEQAFQCLLQCCFPGVRLRNGAATLPVAGEVDEFDDLLQMLLEHRCRNDEIHTWLSYCVASASMRERHLWQDMGLPHRALLSQLLHDAFPLLAGLNTGDMKWKKFFYRQLCQRAGLALCKAPNCADCSDYALCFAAPVTAPVSEPRSNVALTSAGGGR